MKPLRDILKEETFDEELLDEFAGEMLLDENELLDDDFDYKKLSPEQHKAKSQSDADGAQWHKENPVHHQNIVDHYNQSTHEEREHGHNWYKDAHHVMKALAHDSGVTHHQMSGLISNYSPQTAWHTNMITASKVARSKKALGGPGEGVFASGQQKKAAGRMLKGEHYDKVLSGQKVKHFAHLIEHGGNKHADDPGHKDFKTHVVIDRHAHSVASGKRITDNAFGQSGLKGKAKYASVHKAYVDAAAHLSKQHGTTIHPHQVQATTWLTRQRLNGAEDVAKAKGKKGKGGNAAAGAARAKADWHKYAGEHHPHLVGKEPGTGYG